MGKSKLSRLKKKKAMSANALDLKRALEDEHKASEALLDALEKAGYDMDTAEMQAVICAFDCWSERVAAVRCKQTPGQRASAVELADERLRQALKDRKDAIGK